MTNLKIIQENENTLYKRKEIKATVEAKVTPSNKEVEDMLVKKFSSQPENIVIKGIYGEFGSKEFKINANIYETAEDRKKIEPVSKKEVKAEAKPVEAPVEEAPAEEPKAEEVKEEEPKSEEVKPEEKTE